jgi:uncharacterized membrane protein (GlpM family)
MGEYIFAFFVGGAITAAITYLEASGLPLLSRLAALFPIFTWLSYLFIGKIAGPEAVSKHALFVLLGTLFAWLPYMFVIYYFSPKIGPTSAILLGLTVFIILAMVFIRIYPA